MRALTPKPRQQALQYARLLVGFLIASVMEYISLVLVLGVAIVGGYTDVRTGKVYNLLTYPAMLAGAGLQLVSAGPSGLVLSLQGIGVGLGLLILPYLLRAVGGGDVKLLAAVGAFVGPVGAFGVMVLGALAGGILAIGLLIKRRQLTFTLLSLALIPKGTLEAAQDKRDFPFAVTIPLGLILWLLATSHLVLGGPG